MSGPCRFLWCAIVLLATGCPSLQTGSSALFPMNGEGHPPEAEAGAENSDGDQTLWGMLQRRLHSQDAGRPAEQITHASNSSQRAEGERDFLSAVLGGNSEKTTKQPRARRRQEQLASDAEKTPRRAALRRQQDHISDAPTEIWSTDPSAVEAKAQQIILTERQIVEDPGASAASPTTREAEPGAPLMTMSSLFGAPSSAGERCDDIVAPEPRDSRLRDGAFVTVQDIVGGAGEEMADSRSGFMASVFDVFGVGGEHESANQDELAIDPIQPPALLEEPAESAGDDAGDTESIQPTRLNLQSTESLRSVYWQEELDKLIALLETQVAQQTPGESVEQQELYVRQHVALRMLYLIASRRPKALSAIPDVPVDEQEFWTQVFWALSSSFDDEAMPNRAVRAAETVAQLRAAVRHKEAQAALQLQNSLFCQRIDGFGDYVPFPDDRFDSGQQVLIYTEVKNFLSEPTGEGDFRTVLQSTITIRQGSVNGRTMLKQDLPQTEDRCRSRRSDYFHSYRIPLPDTLQPGPHVLILDVTDVLSGQSGRTTMNFVVQ